MKLVVNGKSVDVAVPAETPLLWVLREEVGLTGTKFGCGKALCGACTVHVDGAPKRSCVTPCGDVADKQITTIEGLATGAALHPVQQAWIEENVPQCGYCQAGQIMTAVVLLKAFGVNTVVVDCRSAAILSALTRQRFCPPPLGWNGGDHRRGKPFSTS